MLTWLCFPIAYFSSFLFSSVFSAGVQLAGLRRLRAALLLLAVGLAVQPLGRAQAQEKEPYIEPAETHVKVRPAVPLPNVTGAWETLPFMMPLNPVHIALMHTGKVLVVSGSGKDAKNKVFQAGVWDPKTYTVNTFLISYDMFCNGMVILPNGEPFVLGGTLKYPVPPVNFLGYPKTSLFDPATETFSSGPDMSGGRWYPTATVLGNGNVMVLSGLLDKPSVQNKSVINKTVEIGDGVTWTPAGSAFASMSLFPREHLVPPSGTVFEDGFNADSQMYDPVAHTWKFIAKTNLGLPRDYGTSVLLPLTPANGFKPQVIIMGGGDLGATPPTVTNTTELIDLSASTPKWVSGPNMVGARVQLNATILPSGDVLVSGGSSVNEDAATAVLQAELYRPASKAFTSAGTMEFPRLYHSNTLLLPDARVLAVGSNPGGDFEGHIEIYSPPYLFNPDGTAAKRPLITKVSSTTITYAGSFSISTPDAASIKSVVLIRPGAVTHAFDMEQRLVGLSFKNLLPGTLQVTAPGNGNLAPPGYYLLFILNSGGVPSVAQFVHLGPGVGPISATPTPYR